MGAVDMSISRRGSLALASASIAAVTIPAIGARAEVADVPTADVKPLKFEPEKGAELRVLRPAKFIDPDEVYLAREQPQIYRGNRRAGQGGLHKL